MILPTFVFLAWAAVVGLTAAICRYEDVIRCTPVLDGFVAIGLYEFRFLPARICRPAQIRGPLEPDPCVHVKPSRCAMALYTRNSTDFPRVLDMDLVRSFFRIHRDINIRWHCL